MATYTRQLLSASTNGKPIQVAATAIGSGTLIHTATNIGSTDFDEIYLWVSNTDSVDHQLTLGWGGTGAAQEVGVSVNIPANSAPIPILTGQVLNGGQLLKAAADVTNVLNVFGYVNHIQ